MKSRTMRLDRFISQNTEFSMSDTRLLIARKRILLDGGAAHSIHQKVTQFTVVVLDGYVLQQRDPLYMILHKPQGVVSATRDAEHRTVIDLMHHRRKDELHIVGRLDFNTTGLVLLTNDGAWSRKVCSPESSVKKVYEVTLSKPVTSEYVTVFNAGIYFQYEDSTTKPAHLEIVSDYQTRLTLVEGKYHQVKRMFGFFQNTVIALHRVSIGPIDLGTLGLGENRALDPEEIDFVHNPCG